MAEILHGVNPLRMAQDPDIVPCAVCGDLVEHADKIMVEKEILHKACFTCGYCERKLQMGYCVQELALRGRYGPCWYCTLICAHLPLSKKESALKQRGVEVQKPHTRRPRAPGAADSAGEIPKELEEAEKLIKSYVDKAAASENASTPPPPAVVETQQQDGGAGAVPPAAEQPLDDVVNFANEEALSSGRVQASEASADLVEEQTEGGVEAAAAACAGAAGSGGGPVEGRGGGAPAGKAPALDDYMNKYRKQMKK